MGAKSLVGRDGVLPITWSEVQERLRDKLLHTPLKRVGVQAICPSLVASEYNKTFVEFLVEENSSNIGVRVGK